MIRKTLAAIALLSLSSTAFSAHIVSGSLDASDPTWDGCGSSLATGCYYDVVEFNVSASGLYTFDAFYAGDTSIDENLDGIIEIYEGGFDPLAPGVGGIAFDDDGPGGSNTSQILDVSLSAGTTYFMVISSFTNVANSFGQPTGPWEVTGVGAGDVTFKTTVIPVPAAVWLFVSGLAGLGALRRRRSS